MLCDSNIELTSWAKFNMGVFYPQSNILSFFFMPFFISWKFQLFHAFLRENETNIMLQIKLRISH